MQLFVILVGGFIDADLDSSEEGRHQLISLE